MVLVTLRYPSDDDLETSMHMVALSSAQRQRWESVGITVSIMADYIGEFLCDSADCPMCNYGVK